MNANCANTSIGCSVLILFHARIIDEEMTLSIIRKLAFAAVSMVVSTAIHAQEAASGDALTQGQAAPAQITQEVIGDWTLNCRASDTAKTCELFQILKQADGRPAVAVTLFPIPNNPQAVAGANVIAPLGTLLTAQISIGVDDNLSRVYPFAVCQENGCLARIGLTQDDIDSYKRGNVAKVAIVNAAAPNQPIVVEMSLTGFTKAFDTATSN